MRSRLLYVFDPLCGWCYAAAPLLRAVSAEFSKVLTLDFQPGLLFDPPRVIAPDFRSHIVHADQRIGTLAGVPFGEAYLARIREMPSLVFDSTPPAAAVMAVVELAPEQALAMLEAEQQAHYVNGQDICDSSVLITLATSLGITARDFNAAHQRALEAMPARATKARAILQASGGQGFPTLVLEVGGRRVRVEHSTAYGHPDVLCARIASLLDTYATH